MYLAQAADPGQRGHRVPQPGHEPEPGRGDHGQGALRPGEQRRVVVAGVVLDQPGQVRHDGAVRQDRLDTAQLRAHRPEPQDAQPAGVGRHRPADSCAVPAGDQDPQIQARVGVRHLLQSDPGPGRDLRGLMNDRSEPMQAGQAQHDLAVQGHAAADQAGVTPLRDDGHPGAGAQGEHSRDLGRVTRPDHGRRVPAKRPVQSTAKPTVASPVRTCGSPTMPTSDREQRARQRHHPPSLTGPPARGQADRPSYRVLEIGEAVKAPLRIVL